jgi:hypothetical protein
MKFIALFAILAGTCMVLAAPATRPATQPSTYYAYWLTQTDPNHREYIDLLIAREPIQQVAAKAPLKGLANVVTTYAKDSIWNADRHPFRCAEWITFLDRETNLIRLNGTEYRYSTASIKDVVALLEKPEGTLPVHRIWPPLAGAEEFTRELLGKLKSQPEK